MSSHINFMVSSPTVYFINTHTLLKGFPDHGVCQRVCAAQTHRLLLRDFMFLSIIDDLFFSNMFEARINLNRESVSQPRW